MNDNETFNPFEDQRLKAVRLPLSEVNDEDINVTSRNQGITVQTDVIEDYEPFSNDKIVINLEATLPSERNTASKTFTTWQNDVEIITQRISEVENRPRESEVEIKRIKNFPPFPKFCPIKPCFYQDIDVDIPEQGKNMVKMGYVIWICYCVALLLNLFGTTVVLIVFNSNPALSSTTPTLFGVSLLILLLFIPLSYLFWFRRLYFAFKTDSSVQFFIFFIVFALYIVSLIIDIIGIPQCGVCGWILVVMTNQNIGVMIFMVLIASSFTALLIASVYLLFRVNIYFRSSGGSYTKAKNEIGSNPATNATVKSVVLGLFTSSR